ncbi:MAG: DUF2851 family protein [Sphingobacterium hotanense]
MRISEDILQFIWRFRLFRQIPLFTRAGLPIRILHPGDWNQDAGPDFQSALLIIEDIYICGNVEVHVSAKDWIIHGHHQNPAYNSVVLHVIWEGEEPCYLADGSLLPSLNLRELIEPDIVWKANNLLQNINPIPCAYDIKNVPMHIKVQVLQRTVVERLETRYEQVKILLNETQGDWERVTLILIASAFGMKVNKEQFMALSRILNLKLLKKFAHKPQQIHALFFGQAGLLQKVPGRESYVQELQKEYAYIEKLHGLDSLSPYQWKFMRMRPANFPTFKLAQLASLYTHQSSWFSWITTTESLEEIRYFVDNLEIPAFWSNHYHFEKESVGHSTAISKDFFHLLVINSFSMILFSYGKYMGDGYLANRALEWLEQVPVEINKLVRPYKSLGLPLESALDSQAVLQLWSAYCEKKRCLHCGIGASIINRI